MIKKQGVTTIILILVLVGILSFMWNRYLKDLVLDDYETITLELDASNQLIEFSAPKNQSVYGLSLRITGEAEENIELLMGIEKDQFIKQVSLRKGDVRFEYDSDWYSERCYLLINEKSGQKGNLKIEYKFLLINNP
jgi:hypothetical protein